MRESFGRYGYKRVTIIMLLIDNRYDAVSCSFNKPQFSVKKLPRPLFERACSRQGSKHVVNDDVQLLIIRD